jgi:hypothetical protein
MPNKKSSKSSSTSNASSSSSATGSASAPKSNYQYYKAYGGWPGFMHSFGLKTWDLDDVDEGKAIIRAFREDDAAEAAANAKNK